MLEGKESISVRGYRIDLSSIAEVLTTVGDLESAVLTVGDNKELVARVTPRDDRNFSVDEFRDALAGRLPHFMIPTRIEVTGKTATSHPRDGSIVNETRVSRPSVLRVEIEHRITRIWGTLLRVDSIALDTPFAEVGADSLVILRAIDAVIDLFGTGISTQELMLATTITAMADVVERAVTGDLVSVNPRVCPLNRGCGPKLFVLPTVEGGVIHYAHLARHLRHEVWGVHPAGAHQSDQPLTSIEAMAEHLIDSIRSLQPEAPYFLAGTSFGGLLAYEIAHQLRQQGERRVMTCLFDTWAPGYRPLPEHRSNITRLGMREIGRVRNHWTIFKTLDGSGRLKYISATAAKLVQRVKGENRIRSVALRAIARANQSAWRAYTPPRYEGVVDLFRAQTQPVGQRADTTLGWSKYAPRVQVYPISGFHGECCRDPFAGSLARQLEGAMGRQASRFESVSYDQEAVLS